MARQITIGLLSPFFQPIPGYEQAANELGIQLVIVTAKRVEWKRRLVEGLLWNGEDWKVATVPLPRALYNRYYGPKPKLVTRLEEIIGQNKIFNHVTCFDKWTIHKMLAKSELRNVLPYTEIYSPERLEYFLQRFGQVILKPTSGQLGREIYLVNKVHGRFQLYKGTKSPVAKYPSLVELLEGLEFTKEKSFLLQHFIPFAKVEGRIFDLRLLVQKNQRGIWQVTGALSRHALRYSYVTNLSQIIVSAGQTLEKVFPQAMPKLEALSLEAARVAEQSLGSLGEISVDFGLDAHNKIWLIELNAKPMKSIFADVNDDKLMRRIYQQPLRYASYLAIR